MTYPAGEPLKREEEALATEGLTPAGPSSGWPGRMEGARRPLRVPLKDPVVSSEGGTLFLGFALPKGSYATAVLREVMKDR
jgi:tRNA pseudouridine13 synthase